LMWDWRVPSAWGNVFAEDLNDIELQRLYLPVLQKAQFRHIMPTSSATRSPI
jgi:hypothetical protein